jgi:hypothetical protein
MKIDCLTKKFPITVTKNTTKNLQKETIETSRVSVIQMVVDDVITIEMVEKNVKDIPTKIITTNIHLREMVVDIITSPEDNELETFEKKHSSLLKFSLNQQTKKK